MFRFSIRDLLWLMVVVGMAVGWWTEYKRRTVAQITVTGPAGQGLTLQPGGMAVISADDQGRLSLKTKGPK